MNDGPKLHGKAGGGLKVVALSLLTLVVICSAAVGVFAWRAHSDKRSKPGRIVRWFRGERGAEQRVNDLVDDVRNLPSLGRLQAWSVETLARFRSGQVKTNGRSDELPERVLNVRLAVEERPEFIRREWGETNSWGLEEPEILVLLSASGEPESVAINWYLHGVAVGLPGCRLPFSPYISAEAKPGVWVYHFYK